METAAAPSRRRAAFTCAAPSRASAFARSSSVWRARIALTGWVLNAADGVHIHVEGAVPALEALRRGLSDVGPAGGRADQRRWTSRSAPLAGYRGLRDPRERRHLGAPTTRIAPDPGGVRRLPARAARSRRPPLPLPLHQLHRLRAALLDRPLRCRTTVRRRRWRAWEMCAACASEYRRPDGPAVPRAARRLPGLRTGVTLLVPAAGGDVRCRRDGRRRAGCRPRRSRPSARPCACCATGRSSR